ncbi:hypothetical protein ACIQGO_12745 [Streptomyces shenzhenensis]|uniref:hypothetical protein n=1 Tax=Streptomyces shenzhenensis TaxID=943815 RepID=UPI0037FC4202
MALGDVADGPAGAVGGLPLEVDDTAPEDVQVQALPAAATTVAYTVAFDVTGVLSSTGTTVSAGPQQFGFQVLGS